MHPRIALGGETQGEGKVPRLIGTLHAKDHFQKRREDAHTLPKSRDRRKKLNLALRGTR